jgi:Rieske Fe-S protein
MKLRYSLFTRREFLNGLLGGGLGALFVSLVYPIIKFIFPPYKEPDEVVLPYAAYQDLEVGAVRNFPWGAKPGLLKRLPDGNFLAFVAVCTHLDCTVTYLPDQKKFFCACHQGWYDENGRNIGGPPPRPLRQLPVVVQGENIIVKKERTA